MDLEACLPPHLRGPTTTITRVAAGLSGAGVYRVEAAGQSLALKVSGDELPLAEWRGKLHVQQLAAAAGLAPPIVHVDEDARAILSVFIVDRSFVTLLGDPSTREAALAQLGRTLRRVHELPLPPDAPAKDVRVILSTLWSGIAPSLALPAFAGDAVRRMLAEEAPASERAPVLSHNDVNPTNLVYDGHHLMLLDWDNAGPNDPLYDLAAIAFFLRMDEETCQKLLAAHDGEPVSRLPARFAYNRRMVAVLCGTVFLHLARKAGHTGATGAETLETTPPLFELYQRMWAGSLSLATGEGRWFMGLAMLKDSFSL